MREHCDRCGQPHPWCNGHRKTDGGPCGRRPRKGADVCRQCGGGAPQVQAAAARRRAEQDAAATLARLGSRRVQAGDLFDQLLQVTSDALGWLEVTRDQAQQVVDRGEGLTRDDAAAAVTLYERAIAMASQVIERAARVDLAKLASMRDERLAQIEEAQARLVVQVLTAVVRDLGLEPEARARADRLVVQHLRAVGG